MTCHDIAPLVAHSADDEGSLDVQTRGALDAHLEGCASCRAALETQRAVSSVLRARPADRVSPAFAARLAARLDEASGWFGIADWRVWTLRLAPVAAALALFVLLGAETQAPWAPLEEWTIAVADSASPAAALWQSDVSPESLMETMLIGETPAGNGGATDVR
jgi:anti-sigma factor RsiW